MTTNTDYTSDHPIQSFEQLFNNHYPLLVRAAYYIIKDQDSSHDLVQDVFLKIWNKREQLEKISNHKAFLLTTVKNQAIDFINERKRKIQKEGEYLELLLRDTHKTAMEDTTENKELEKEISRLVSKLPSKCRLIFSLNRFEGLTNSEIAEYLGLSKRTVEAQISNALKSLRNNLNSKIGDYLTCYTWLVLLVSL